MKRSHYSSFVSPTGVLNPVSQKNNENYISTSSHSLPQNATLATHFNKHGQPIYDPNFNLAYTRSPAPLPFQPASTSPAQPVSAPLRAPLTGLGITFNNGLENGSGFDSHRLPSVSMPVSIPLRIPLSTYLSANYSPFVNDVASYTPYQNYIRNDWGTSSDTGPPNATSSARPGSEAYSTCPAEEYLAPSPTEDYALPLLVPLEREGPLYFQSPCLQTELAPSPDGMMVPSALEAESLTPMIGIFADINFREQGWEKIPPPICVNPALLTGDGLDVAAREQSVSPVAREMQRPTGVSQEDSLKDAVTTIVSVLSTPIDEENAANGTISPVVLTASSVSVTGPSLPKRRKRQYTNDNGLTAPAFAVRSGSVKHEIPPTPDLSAPMTVLQGRATLGDITSIYTNRPRGPIDMGSPVLNAHAGIDLEDLRRKADEFRTRNDCDLDKSWLQAFAGRLSKEGELTEEFRCYVNGCTQTNRRRDHILVHVGSHVEHRPYSCLIWYVIFSFHFSRSSHYICSQRDEILAKQRMQTSCQ